MFSFYSLHQTCILCVDQFSVFRSHVTKQEVMVANMQGKIYAHHIIMTDHLHCNAVN